LAAPTVLVDVDHSMDCVREETFGPTLPVMKVRDAAEAIEKSAASSGLGIGGADSGVAPPPVTGCPHVTAEFGRDRRNGVMYSHFRARLSVWAKRHTNESGAHPRVSAASRYY
jgi:hypothetical protein